MELSKSVASEKERLKKLLGTMESRVAKAFQEFVKNSTDEKVIKLVTDLVTQGRVDAALTVIGPHVTTMSAVLSGVFVASAEQEIAQVISDGLASPISVAFDPTNPRASDLMRAEKMSFIRQFTDEQLNITRNALIDGIMNGDGPKEIARAFKDSIGLTRAQDKAVANYRRLLQENDKQSLNRALRDRRFDSSVRASISGKRPLTPDKIDTMVARYRQRFIDYRAETIARTEGGRALSLGRQEAMEQLIETGAVTIDDVLGQWNTTMDGRERESHAEMDNQEKPFNQAFISGLGNKLRYPRDPEAPADDTINCRCNVIYRIKVKKHDEASSVRDRSTNRYSMALCEGA